MKTLTVRLPYRWVALGIAALGIFATTADASIVAISLPELTVALDTRPATVIWVIAAYLLTSVGLVLGMGRLSDALGSKRLFNLGFLVFTLGLIMSASAQTVFQLIAFRVVTATGGAMLLSSTVALATDAFPSQERGRAMGILSAVTSAGLAVGPLVGGVLLDSLGWRSVFYLRIPLGVVGLGLGVLLLREMGRERSALHFDFAGALTIFAGLVSIVLAINQAPSWGLTSPAFLGLLLFGVLMLGLFVRVERGASQPIVDLSVFRNRVYASSIASMFLYFLAVGTAYYLLPFLLIQGLGYSSTIAGFVFALVPFSMGVLSPMTGGVSDRIGTRLLTTVGITVSAVTLVAMSFLGEGVAVGIVVLVLLFHGIGSGLFEAPNISAIMGSASQERLGLASASVAVSRQIGLALGIAVGSAIFVARREVFEVSHSSAGAVVQGFQDAVLFMAAAAGIGILVAALRGKA